MQIDRRIPDYPQKPLRGDVPPQLRDIPTLVSYKFKEDDAVGEVPERHMQAARMNLYSVNDVDNFRQMMLTLKEERDGIDLRRAQVVIDHFTRMKAQGTLDSNIQKGLVTILAEDTFPSINRPLARLLHWCIINSPIAFGDEVEEAWNRTSTRLHITPNDFLPSNLLENLGKYFKGVDIKG